MVRSTARWDDLAGEAPFGLVFLTRTSDARGDLVVVGAEYALETGDVDFFDEVPA